MPKPVFCAMPTQPDYTSAAAGTARTSSGQDRTVLAWSRTVAERSADFGERGAHVRRCGAAGVVGAVGVPGVGVGDGEPEVALDPGQGGVAEPVGADLLGGFVRVM
jgi:hypothetical protein